VRVVQPLLAHDSHQTSLLEVWRDDRAKLVWIVELKREVEMGFDYAGKWRDCTRGDHPRPGYINGFHKTVGVIAYVPKGREMKIVPCYFKWQGGDKCEPSETPQPSYHTDEGLSVGKVTHWMELPPPPSR